VTSRSRACSIGSGRRCRRCACSGIVDHMYGEYQQTGREEFEEWCRPHFKELRRVPGIAGLDVTREIYADDPYYTARFGTGHMRYLCFK